MNYFKYFSILRKLTPKYTLFKSGPKTVFILSGQSDITHSTLRKGQIQALRWFAEHTHYAAVFSGFPFNRKYPHQQGSGHFPGPVKASINNIIQFLFLYLSQNYPKIIARHLAPAFQFNGEVLILSQSSGINIFLRSCKYLDLSRCKGIKVVCFGPTCRKIPKINKVSFTLIQGRNDRVSQLMTGAKIDMVVDCGHMDYLKIPHTIDFARVLNL